MSLSLTNYLIIIPLMELFFFLLVHKLLLIWTAYQNPS